jgi:bacterioferritin
VKHALFLADKIVALGGKPEVEPAPFKTLTDPKTMLEHDLDLEREAIKHYTERVQQAEAAGEIGLKVRLEDIIADETDHAEAIVRLLGK